MKRYKIIPELINAIRNSRYNLTKLSKLSGFEVKNLIYCNKTIREDHLSKLNSLLNINFQLQEINLDYGKNLGKHAVTKPIKQINEDEDLAEFIGIMLGDGSIYGNQITISFDIREKKYIDYVINLVKNLSGIELKGLKEKAVNGFRIYCCNKFLVERLIELGLKRGDKIKNQIGIPQWIKQNPEFSKRCLKGLVDTDGCIIFCKRDKQRSINFTNNNITLLNDFKEISKKLGYNFARANKSNTRLYRKIEVARFIKDILPFKSIDGDVC